MLHIDLFDARKQLFDIGYKILPNKGKIPVIHGWNTPEHIAHELTDGHRGMTALERIKSWETRFVDAPSTGVRIENGLGVIDIDVDDPLVDRLLEEIVVITPVVGNCAPTRYGSSEWKMALFVRIEGEKFIRIASKKYNGHQVEIFGGAPLPNGKCSRQFGVLGPYYNKEGMVEAEYVWADSTPKLCETPISALPAISKAMAFDICKAFEELAQEAGWKEEKKPDIGNASVVYDIDDDTRFNTNRGGIGISYAELCDEFQGYGDSLRCDASFIDGEDGKNTSRCWIFQAKGRDLVGIYDHGDAVTHYPKPAAPAIDRIIDGLKQMNVRPEEADEPPEPDAGASVQEKAEWLTQTRGYYEGEDCVVRLYATSLDCRVKPGAFERRFKAWFAPGAAQRSKPIFATDLWGMSPTRKNIAGVRMDPSKPFPLFEENGRLFKNTYRRPRHIATDGDIAVFMDFLSRFIPDEIEMEWLLSWMAHKLRRPDVPGTSILFVADTEEGVREGSFGTGRGLMFRIAHRLFGEDYARSQSFSMLEGSNGQSAFNDWMHGATLITVDEAKTSPTSHRRGERNAAYEILKDVVDPAPKLFSFKGKYRAAFDGMSYCSFWVASNHANALAIPAHDRRFTVLRNGRPVTTAEASAIADWTRHACNIGALAEFLGERDLAGFDMYQPLATAGKAEMAELALSDVEEHLRDLIADTEKGLAFTKSHIEKSIEHNFNGHGGFWHGEFKAAWHAYCVGLRGPTGLARRVRMAGTQRKLFCFRDHEARVKQMPEAAIRREVGKWGGIDAVVGLGSRLGLSEKDE